MQSSGTVLDISSLEENEREQYVNVESLNEENTPKNRIALRDLIAADNLEAVNRISAPVQIRNSVYTKYIKRVIDIVVSLTALIITCPINIVLLICTYFDVGSPIIFRQSRTGKDGKAFHIIKFRNMTNATDENGNLLPAKERVTRFGKFVRKASLDELLNFWSILKGDMSLIGPRPLSSSYTDYLSERHKQRHAVRPGLECPILHNANHKPTWLEQFENDVWYVENLSFMTDVRMILALVGMVFDKKSAAVRGSAARGSFMGYSEDGKTINSQYVPKKYVDALLNGRQARI